MLIENIGGNLLLEHSDTKQLERKAVDAKDWPALRNEMMLVDNSDSVDTEEWSMPVADGSNGSASSQTTIAAEDVAKFPGWGEQVIQRYLDSGWTTVVVRILSRTIER